MGPSRLRVRGRCGAVATALAIVALLTAACGGGGESGNGGGSAEKTARVNIGVLPISDVAPLYLGIKKGFFRAQHLDVKPRIMQGGAAVVAGVVSGSLNFGFAATEPLILAKAKGLPVKIVTAGNQAAEDPKKPWTALMVRGNSGVKEPRDLEGKTIAANALQSTPQLATLSMLDKAGVDVGKLKFIEVPFPDMPAALTEGTVAAVTAAEPFLPQLRAQGAKSLGDYFYEMKPGMTIGTYFTLEKQIQEDPQLIRRFATAMNKSLDYADTHRDEARATIKTYAKIPPNALQKIEMPPWSSDLRRPTIQFMADQCLKYHFIDKPVQADSIIWQKATR